MRKQVTKLTSLVLGAAMLVGLCPTAFAAGEGDTAQQGHVIINQVYGGSDDGEASHSFIELYNPTGEAVSLEGWSVQYRSSQDGAHNGQWNVKELEGSIDAQGHYLVRCGATADGAYSVPEGDVEWDIQLHNKGLSVALVDNTTVLSTDLTGDVTIQEVEGLVDVAAVQGNDTAPEQIPPIWEGAYSDIQSKKKAIRRVNFADTDNNAADFETVDYSGEVSQELGPHNSTGSDTQEPEKPTYTPVTTTDKQYVGYENQDAVLALTQIGRYNAGAMNADGGSAEIVAYNQVNGCAYVVNGLKGTLDCVSLAVLTSTNSVQNLNGVEIDVKALVNVDGFTYGDMTSVALSPDGSALAAAIQAEGYADSGRVALFTCNTDGTLTFVKAVEVGVQPDMVTFTPDGAKILTANEGEPRLGYGAGTMDPAGTVTVIDVTSGVAQNVGFDSFDAQRDALVSAGIVLKKGTNPSVDLEPEYIACTNTTAYVSLQEANAIGVLDLTTNTFTGVYSCGFEDYSVTSVDINKEDGQYQPKTYEGLMGIRMPDGVALYTVNGVDYLLTANEGDSREWGDYLNEAEAGKGEASLNGNIAAGEVAGKVVYFDTTDYDGLQAGVDYLFGGRSFTLFRVDSTGLTQVFSSDDDFESITAGYLPDYFNCSNDDKSVDDRSGKKGPEAETVTVGQVEGETYAFVTLERIGGVMVYRITDPTQVSYVNYINSRDFSADIMDDVSAEGLKFIPAQESATGKALLLAACEVSGTMAVYELTVRGVEEDNTKPEESPKPEQTPAPEESPKPQETPAPEETLKPQETPAPEESAKPEEEGKNPQTGDESSLGRWSAVLVGAGAILGLALVIGKKEEEV